MCQAEVDTKWNQDAPLAAESHEHLRHLDPGKRESPPWKCSGLSVDHFQRDESAVVSTFRHRPDYCSTFPVVQYPTRQERTNWNWVSVWGEFHA